MRLSNFGVIENILALLVIMSFGNVLLSIEFFNATRMLIFLFLMTVVIFNATTGYASSLLQRKRFLLLIFVIAFWCFWTIYPARPFNAYGQFASMIAILIVFMGSGFDKEKVLVIVVYMASILGLLSILTAILLILTFGTLPSAELIYNGRPIIFYYTGSGSLLSNHFNEPFHGARLSSLFGEPGHAAVFFLLCWWLSSELASRRVRFVIFLAGLLTFSLVFYIGFVAILSLRYKKQFLALGVILGAIFFSLLAMNQFSFDDDPAVEPDSVYYRFYSRNLETIRTGEFLDGRTGTNWDVVFNEMDLTDFLVGLGGSASSHTGNSSSDLRGFVYKYGLIGFLIFFLYLLSLFSFAKGSDRKDLVYSGLFIIIFVFLHRHWFVDNFGFMYLSTFGIITLANKRKYILKYQPVFARPRTPASPEL